VKKHPLITYFTAVFSITWGIGAVSIFAPTLVKAYFPGAPLTNPLFYIAVYAPTVTSLILTVLFDGASGLRQLLARLIPWRAGLKWYVVVLAGYPAVAILAGTVGSLFDICQVQLPDWGKFYYALIPALAVDPGPVGEELGWRGFALPRMLERWTPLTASLLLGFLWGVWHLPAFFIAGLPHKSLAFLALLVATISVSIIDTWVFLRTGGNVLLMILVHLMTNHCFKMLGIPFGVSVAAGVFCAVLIVLAGGMRVRARG
jgi:uncharacterized protein